MQSGRRTSGWCFTVLSGALACSGHVDSPNDGQASAGRTSTVAGAAAGGTPTAGSGSAGLAGAAGTAASAGGVAGAGPASVAGTAGQAAGGVVSNEAEAQLVPIAGMPSGTARFKAVGDRVELLVTLAGCPEGPHALHLHANAACADGGNAAGGHWSPQGELVPDVTCALDGSGQLSFTSEPGVWSLGAPATSDVLRHALILHAGPSEPEPGARIACGIAVKVP